MDHARPPAWWAWAAWALLAANVALLAAAVRMGSAQVRDDAAGVTDGWTIAGGIVLSLAVVAAATRLPFPPRTRLLAVLFGLGAQALHAGGHVLRLYYLIPWYDDLLHFGLVALLGLVILGAARSPRFLFSWRMGAWRVAALVWLTAVAAAGLWELFEFTADVALGTREQDDLVDTMVDMLDGAAGGSIAALVAYRRVRAEARAKALADARSDELLD